MDYPLVSETHLAEICKKYTRVIILRTKEGALLFIQQGGRLLGMYPRTTNPNTLWVNPDFETKLESMQPILGGDRLWLSPTRNFFFENPRDFCTFTVPFEIDPGEYRYISDTRSVIFKNSFSLLDYSTNMVYDNCISERNFYPLINDPFETFLPFVGVSITDTISIPDPSITFAGCSRTLIPCYGPQTPATVLLPVDKDSFPITCESPISPEKVHREQGYIRIKIDGTANCRIGIPPEHIRANARCKCMYLTPLLSKNALWACIIKDSIDLPTNQDECTDIPKNGSMSKKAAVFCSDSLQTNQYSAHGEIELCFAKARQKDNGAECKATHVVYSYQGTKQEMLSIAKRALKLSDTPKIFFEDTLTTV